MSDTETVTPESLQSEGVDELASARRPSRAIEVTDPPKRQGYVVTFSGRVLTDEQGDDEHLQREIYQPHLGDLLVLPDGPDSPGPGGEGSSPEPRRPEPARAVASRTDTDEPEPTRASGSATSGPDKPR